MFSLLSFLLGWADFVIDRIVRTIMILLEKKAKRDWKANDKSGLVSALLSCYYCPNTDLSRQMSLQTSLEPRSCPFRLL